MWRAKRPPGLVGSFWGGVRIRILLRLGCLGFEGLGFRAFRVQKLGFRLDTVLLIRCALRVSSGLVGEAITICGFGEWSCGVVALGFKCQGIRGIRGAKGLKAVCSQHQFSPQQHHTFHS